MWGIGVNTSVSNNNQTSNAYKETNNYNDQSVKDTMIQNYITNITTRSEDVTELVKNFNTNVMNEAEAIQKNNFVLNGCLELEDVDFGLQENTLKQDVAQGFEQFEEDVKKLKKILDTTSETSTNTQQGASEKQESTEKTDLTSSQ